MTFIQTIAVTTLLLFLFCSAGSVFADSQTVSNRINVEANTGGNTVDPGGKKIEGESSADVYIETTVNGKTTVRDISTSTNGSVSVYVKQTTTDDGATSSVSVSFDGPAQQASGTDKPLSTTSATSTGSLLHNLWLRIIISIRGIFSL